MKKVLQTGLRLALLPAAILAATPAVWAQTTTEPAASAVTPAAMTPCTGDKQYTRASEPIGKNVHGADGKNIGEVNDLVVAVITGHVRYVMFEYDPSVFKTGKVSAVPLKSLALAADGKTLSYAGVDASRSTAWRPTRRTGRKPWPTHATSIRSIPATA